MTDGLLALTTMTASGDLSCGCDALASVDSGAVPALDPAPDPVQPSQSPDPSALGSSAYWEGCIGMEGQLTGDGRFIEANALTWSLPMPLRYVSSDVGEHGGAQVAGRILTAERRPGGVIWAGGDYDLESPIGLEAERQVRMNLTNGISMDLDDVSFEVRIAQDVMAEMQAMHAGDGAAPALPAPNADGTVTVATIKSSDEVRATLSARIRAATIVAIPAFADAKIYSSAVAPVPTAATEPPVTGGTLSASHSSTLATVPPPAPQGDAKQMDGMMPDGQTPCSTDPNDSAFDPDCVARSEHDDLPAPPMQLLASLASNPKNAGSERKLIAWYEHGEGAAKIRWGTPGDFDRCRKIAGKHMPPDETSGFCANRHHAVTGEWPGKDAHKGGKHSALNAVVAAAPPMSPPSAWFDNPRFTSATAMTVTEEGHIYGHLAAWNTCHIGMGRQGCVTAPKSRSGYAYFHTGSIVTAENAEISVGHITLDTTHAPTTGLSAAGAQNHYERTGHVVADVVAGEDAYGIWVSGALRPGVTASQVRELRAAPLSGDWRRVSGSLELVAALAVNVPGFPIPRPKGLVAGGVVQSLVASGMMPPRQVRNPELPGALSLDDLRYLKRLADRERAEEATLIASGSLPTATELARRVRASSLAMRAHSQRKV